MLESLRGFFADRQHKIALLGTPLMVIAARLSANTANQLPFLVVLLLTVAWHVKLIISRRSRSEIAYAIMNTAWLVAFGVAVELFSAPY